MSVIKGFSKLSTRQQELFNRVHARHMDDVEDKAAWEPKCISFKDGYLKVTFKNGEWLRYTTGGEWY